MPQEKNSLRTLLLTAATICLLAVLAWLVFLRPTRILVVNATLAQQADVALNNDSRRIRLRFARACRVSPQQVEAVCLFDGSLPGHGGGRRRRAFDS